MKKFLLLAIVGSVITVSILKTQNSSEKEVASKQTKKQQVLTSLIKIEGNESQSEMLQKAYLGLTSLFANQDPQAFIQESSKNTQALLAGLKTSDRELAIDMAKRIASSDENNITDEDARQALIDTKNTISSALKNL